MQRLSRSWAHVVDLVKASSLFSRRLRDVCALGARTMARFDLAPTRATGNAKRMKSCSTDACISRVKRCAKGASHERDGGSEWAETICRGARRSDLSIAGTAGRVH